MALLASAWVAKEGQAAEDPGSVPPWPLVHILATDSCASEAGGDTATFTVFRTGPEDAPLTVRYRLAGTAANGVDYAELSGRVTIPANACSAPITIAPLDDGLVEGVETIAVFLEQAAIWPPPYVVCWPSFALAQLEDNDVAPSNRPPLVRITNPPDDSVFLGPVDLLLVAQASDLDGRVRTVEFFAGNISLGIVSNRPPIIRPVPIVADALELAVEQDPLVYPDLELDANVDVAIVRPTAFTLRWEDVPAGPHTLVAVATDNQGASTRSEPVHIRVTEPSPQPLVNVRASDPLASEPDPSADRLNTATFTIHRSGTTEEPLTVFYRLGGTAENGVDYAELAHSVTIPRGSSTAHVVIEPLDDKLAEGPENVVLRVIAPACIAIYPPPPDCYAVGPYDTARAIIHDNDVPPNQPPLVELVRPLDGSVFLAPADIVLIAAARDFDGRVVTVEFFAGDRSLGIVTNQPNTLTARTPQFALKWPNVPAGHYLLTAEATDNDGAIGRSKPIEIMVVDRVVPPIVTIEATDAEAAEGSSANTTPNTATLTVKRTGPTDRSLAVFFRVGGTAANGVDYRLLSSYVTIPSGASSVPIVVEPIDDRQVEGPESVDLTLLPSPCFNIAADITLAPDVIRPLDCYLVGAENHARAVIRDNDVAPSNTPPRVVIVQPEDGEIFVAPADIRLCASAHDALGFVRTVEFFADGRSLGIVTNQELAVANAGIDWAPGDSLFCLAWPKVGPGRYVLTAEATDNRGLTGVSEPIQIRVIENHPLPVVTISAVDPFASEGGLRLDPVAFEGSPADSAEDAGDEFVGPPILVRPKVAVFAVSRDRGTNQPLTVHYSLGGTAENGQDYRKLEGTVTIPIGAKEARIIIEPIDDNLIEGTETVIASLEPVA